MKPQNLLTLSLATLVMCSVACTGLKSESTTTPDAKAEAKADCSNLVGTWSLDEALSSATKIGSIQFAKSEDGELTFAIEGSTSQNVYKLNGDEQTAEENGKKINVSGTCTQNGMLVINQEVEGNPKGRWVFVQMGHSPIVQLTLQKLTEVMDGPKGKESLQVSAEDVVSGSISRVPEQAQVEVDPRKFGPQ